MFGGGEFGGGVWPEGPPPAEGPAGGMTEVSSGLVLAWPGGNKADGLPHMPVPSPAGGTGSVVLREDQSQSRTITAANRATKGISQGRCRSK